MTLLMLWIEMKMQYSLTFLMGSPRLSRFSRPCNSPCGGDLSMWGAETGGATLLTHSTFSTTLCILGHVKLLKFAPLFLLPLSFEYGRHATSMLMGVKSKDLFSCVGFLWREDNIC